MIISNSRRFIFLHVAKTAGTAVKQTLDPHLAWNDIHLGHGEDGDLISDFYWRRHRLWKHAAAAQVREVVGAAVWDDYLTFATVRCPYERLASLWGFLAEAIEPMLPGVAFPTQADAAARMAWLDAPACPREAMWHWAVGRAYLRLLGRPDAFSAFLRAPEATEDATLQPQATLLCDPADGRVLPRLVLRHEELAARWPDLATAIGLPGLALRKANRTAPAWRRPTAALFADPADRQLVAERYKMDFECFGFAPWSR